MTKTFEQLIRKYKNTTLLIEMEDKRYAVIIGIETIRINGGAYCPTSGGFDLLVCLGCGGQATPLRCRLATEIYAHLQEMHACGEAKRSRFEKT